MRGLAISPPRFSKYCEIAILPEFSEKRFFWGEILVWSPYFWNAYITDMWGGILAMKGGVRVGTKHQKQQRLVRLDGGTFNNQLG